MEQQLAASIQSSLALGLHDNARFLAERLVAAAPTESHKYLLASCYRHCNQGYRAVQLLKGSSSPQARYLAALCCLELRQYSEAEALLAGQGEAQVPCGGAGWYLLGRAYRLSGRSERAASCYVRALRLDPLLWSAYAELCGLGQPDKTAEFCEPAHLAGLQQQEQEHPIQEQQQPQPLQQQHGQQAPQQPALRRVEQQVQQQQQVPGMNGLPSFQAMNIDGTDGITPSPELAAAQQRPSSETPAGPGAFAAGHTPTMLNFVTPSPSGAAAAAPAPPQKGPGGLFPGFQLPDAPAGSRTPTLGKQKASSGAHPAGVSALAPGGAAAGGHGHGHGGGRGRKAPKAAGRLFASDSSTPRRSARLAASQGDAGTPGGGGHTPTPLGCQDPNQMQQPSAAPALRQRQARGGRIGGSANSSGSGSEDARENAPAGAAAAALPGRQQELLLQQQPLKPPPPASQQAHQQLLALLLPLRRSLHLLSQYRCRDALAALAVLPACQAASAGVLLLRGRCLLELGDHGAAADVFEAARAADPLNMEGLELFSTVLWHLKRDVELSHLAQHALAVDRLAPEAWCVAGNALSLAREHDAAVSLFQRALQLEPRFAYAATLLGHEHLAGEDHGAAALSYRHALSCEPRHYNALYGLGQVALKQEKLPEALAHFEAAAAIHPGSSVLRCCAGATLRRMGRLHEAARQLRAAISLDGRNPLARFEVAHVLMALERHGEALGELQQLQALVPREASVHFLLGRLHKRLRDPGAALASLHAALDLAGCAGERAAIKAAIERVHLAEEDEEEEL